MSMTMLGLSADCAAIWAPPLTSRKLEMASAPSAAFLALAPKSIYCSLLLRTTGWSPWTVMIRLPSYDQSSDLETFKCVDGYNHTLAASLLAHFSQLKICLQSFFMLITVQPLALASSYRDCGKAPTLVSGNLCAGP